ncbi:MAG: membrane protein insertase YidC [Alphaproteobacteria bacterium]
MLNMRPNDPHSAEDRARTLIAVILSLAILFGYYVFYAKPHADALRREAEKAKVEKATLSDTAAASPSSAGETTHKAVVSRSAALKESVRVPIDGDRIEGSIALTGARFDDIRLKEHYADLAKTEKVALLNPPNSEHGYYVDNGWLSTENGVVRPDESTVWTLSQRGAQRVTGGGKPVILEWDSGRGLKFETEISLDKDFLFTIVQRVTNNGKTPVPLNAYHTASRNNLPTDFRGFYALHEGPIGFLDGKTVDPQYKSLSTNKDYELPDRTGWLGISDKYWLVTMLPNPDQHFNVSITGKNFGEAGKQHYQADVVNTTATVKPGETFAETSRLYVGAKDLKAIQGYQEKYGYANFEVTFDFGIYYIITKPFYYLLAFLINITGNVGMGMLLLTIIVRAGMFPVASKSFRSMAKMRIVGPMMKELQEQYKDDKVKLQQEIYDLYKKYDVNPFSGCLPILIQIPVFFALYKVILLAVELRHAPFWGWVPDLSEPDPTTIFNLFGLLPFNPPFSFTLGAWSCIYCATMVLQKNISPPLPDPAQEKMQAYFPYFFSLMMAQFPSGLVIYYSWSNLLGVFQQYYILKEVGGHDTSLLRGHAERRKPKKDGKHKGKNDDPPPPSPGTDKNIAHS